MLNYNLAFAPTAAAERFIKAHRANLPTYCLIAAVVFLEAALATLNFISEQVDRIPEYQIICKLAIVRNQRRAVALAIAIERRRINFLADCRAFAASTAKRRRIAAASLRAFAISVSQLMDKVFCLN